MNPLPVHVVTGFLGAGKTSLVLDQLGQRTGRCAVIVNDFGEARVDATLLEGRALVRDIPGGCVCCTAPEALVPTLRELLADESLERIYIEATGLARPADIVDTLRRSPLADRISLAPVVAVVDPERLLGDTPPLVLEQLQAADVWVANRMDLASEAAVAAFRKRSQERYPPVQGVHLARHGHVPAVALEGTTQVPPLPVDATHSTEGWNVASATWGPHRVFDMGRIKALLRIADAERIKGVLHTDIGWYLVQRASGENTVVPTCVRGGSRMDVIGQDEPGVLEAWLDTVDAAEWVPPAEGAVPVVRLVDSAGEEQRLDRRALLALPDQVEDIGQWVPGREGRAVLLSRVLEQATPPAGAVFQVVASDGMVTDPAPVEAVGDALLVHSLPGESPLPQELGGPFRILVPPGEGRSACANVKKVARVLVTGP